MEEQKKTNNQAEHIWKSENGAIVVEASFTLIIFALMLLTIIMLINLFLIHNRMQFVLNRAANELATYSYLYQITGAREGLDKVKKDFKEYDQQVDRALELAETVQNTFQAFGNNNFEGVQSGAESIYGQVPQIKEDIQKPTNYLKGAAYKAFDWGVTQTLQAVSTDLLEKMMKSDVESLEKEFSISNFQCKVSHYPKDHTDSIITAEVTYDFENSFLWPFRDDHKFHIVQEVNVAAWFDGDGKKLELE